jgi:tetratricopeptide (TPR) repeat protein
MLWAFITQAFESERKLESAFGPARKLLRSIQSRGFGAVQMPIILIALACLLSGCTQPPCSLDPTIIYLCPETLVDRLPTAFEPLSSEEKKQDWGKELLIANSFAKEMDLYRAITSYKRAKVLIPKDNNQRLLQIEYDIVSCYYLGSRYHEVIENFECSGLKRLSATFPGINNLILMLYDSYGQIGEEERAQFYYELIDKFSPETAEKLILSAVILEGDVDQVEELVADSETFPYVDQFLAEYHCDEKSMSQARLLNALLP